MPKIFFATDLHGSEMCWRKFINAARFYDCEVLICGGDMTGKAMIPIVEEGDGRFSVTMADEHDRTRQLIDSAGHRIDIICERTQRVLHGDDVDTLDLQ